MQYVGYCGWPTGGTSDFWAWSFIDKEELQLFYCKVESVETDKNKSSRWVVDSRCAWRPRQSSLQSSHWRRRQSISKPTHRNELSDWHAACYLPTSRLTYDRTILRRWRPGGPREPIADTWQPPIFTCIRCADTPTAAPVSSLHFTAAAACSSSHVYTSKLHNEQSSTHIFIMMRVVICCSLFLVHTDITIYTCLNSNNYGQ